MSLSVSRPLGRLPRCSSSAFQQSRGIFSVATSRPLRRFPQCCTSIQHSKRTISKSRTSGPMLLSKTAQENELANNPNAADMVTEIGLMLGTFVRPPANKVPSLTSERSKRIKFEKEAIKAKIASWMSLFVWKFFMKEKKPRPALQFRERIPIAKSLYENLFTSFAEADTAELRKIAGVTLMKSLRLRLSQRPETERQSWRIISHVSNPVVLSDRAAKLPVADLKECGLRQVIVRLHTRQELQRWKVDQKPNVQRTEKEVVEYMLMQQPLWKGEMKPWRVWGFIQPSTLETLAEEKARYNALVAQSRAAGTS